MHIHQENHWNRVLFYWYQSHHWYQWRPFLSPLTPMESICEYWTTLRDLAYLYLSVLLSLFFSTLDIYSWKVNRFVLINILPSAVDFWSERLTYPFYEQLKRRESSKESTWRIQCFSIPTWSIKSFANRAKFYGYLVILYLDNKL